MEVIVSHGVRHISQPFIQKMEAALEPIAQEYRESYRTQILVVQAYRTGEFHRAVTVMTPTRFQGDKVIDVDSDVYKSAEVQNERPEGLGTLIEGGTSRMPPRYPAARAIQESEPFVLGKVGGATQQAIDEIQG